MLSHHSVNHMPNVKTQRKRNVRALTVWFFILYLLFVLTPTATIGVVDWSIEHLRGIRYVDGWTPGVMVYTGLLVTLPIIYCIVLFVILRSGKIPNHTSDG